MRLDGEQRPAVPFDERLLLGKAQGEVQEDGWEEEHADPIHPVEAEVPIVELPAEGKSGQKPEDAQEVEMAVALRPRRRR